VTKHYSSRISPFGNPWIKASVQLPMAFRRLRVLLRQFVPRHSSSALFSLLYAAFTELLDALLLLYVAFKELVFLFAAHSIFVWIGSAAKRSYTLSPYACQGHMKIFMKIDSFSYADTS
jgi:hypothetical protein